MPGIHLMIFFISHKGNYYSVMHYRKKSIFAEMFSSMEDYDSSLRTCVVIPMYQNILDEYENLSLAQGLKILSRYPVIVIKPESLDLSPIQKLYPHVKLENFADEYFTGLQSYSRLMLSTAFYEKFLQYDYMLIYQLDAWVFRDELDFWCDKDYDYIGSPWVIKPKYNLLPLRIFIWLKSKYYKLIGKVFDHELRGGKVGNGGFSLRKIQSLYHATLKQRDKIDYYLERSKTNINFYEDTFWAVENPDFRYPSLKEALHFSFDNHPELCMKMTNGTLPFGCHGWSKRRNINFWKKIISPSI